MPTCQWLWIRGCMRCIDGVSPNRTHIQCDTRNGPHATVGELEAGGAVGGWSFPTFAGGGGAVLSPQEAVLLSQAGAFGTGPVLVRDTATGTWLAVSQQELATAWSYMPPMLSLPEVGASGGVPPMRTPVAVPEPGAALMFVVALVALAVARCRMGRAA
ncbi:hypothetical protein [Roseomonas indoligenes]|uniref:PEP-CTERM protein-sorting domain-containing protein n=1 Tax=Roseomonas indoligenes TaxID=2820811 RepID=A0A940MVX9_9PROT|nr:hypothetical protein [Pararoseomonas indoligenes]MBP0492212.1 hypothetical protein [Pararoseomonas indoligenes]